ncbi:hypothetical protein DFR58_11877 [Anaerobacterium chartisolvens]|uniref:Uncharacterized protein n=1 Tax=Anaerobacterium chartisolvens TaxID=1297424 RepID=A0A369AVB0_9FIRM|nr:hypothetical protein [Anaerobacterium chartisolvens]RCX13259.1 hypothetical protein DFR58_11877 [Anaerobacterium chartisolvens]
MNNGMLETERLLKEYRRNKERVNALQGEIKRLAPEEHSDYIEYRMYGSGYSGAAPKFVMEKGVEVSQLNKVEAAAMEYRKGCVSDYRRARAEMEKELKRMRYDIAVVEEGVELLGRINKKYGTIVKSYYINCVAMEQTAYTMNMSLSRCYGVCREAVRCLAGLICGNGGTRDAV